MGVDLGVGLGVGLGVALGVGWMNSSTWSTSGRKMGMSPMVVGGAVISTSALGSTSYDMEEGNVVGF